VTLYCESSAVVSIYLREHDRHAVVQGELEREPIASSVLSYVEVRATLARAGFRETPRRLTRAGYNRAIQEFESDWPSYVRLPVTEELIQSAAELARTHLLRAYDAVHLATALALSEQIPDRLLVSTWDQELATAAEAAGLSLAHEVPQ
jgi:uncharacterized protein